MHAHHIQPWAEGGSTKLANLTLLCPSHMLVHEGRLRVEMRDGELEFRNVHGLKLQPVPERCEDIESVAQWLNAIEPELTTDHFPKWDGSRLDLDLVSTWMHAVNHPGS